MRVSQLRKALGGRGERLETRPGGYVLRVAGDELDARRFERLARLGRDRLAAGAPEAAAAALAEALELWRGPALDATADVETIRLEASRLEELRLVTVEDSLEAALALGGHAEAVAELEALTAEHPLRERRPSSACAPCTAPGDRPTRSLPTTTGGGGCSTRAACSGRRSACAGTPASRSCSTASRTRTWA